MKQAGILLPLSSLPSPYGIGTLGKEAYKFIDFLKDSNQTIWQLLPIHQTSYGDSPYQSPSAFAGNPYFIDIEALIDQGLLTKKEAADQPPTTEYVDYAHVYYARYPLLRLAFSRFDARKYPDYEDFCARHAFWLNDYATFMAIKGTYDFQGRNTWDLADRRKDTLPADKVIDQSVSVLHSGEAPFSVRFSAVSPLSFTATRQPSGRAEYFMLFPESSPFLPATPERQKVFPSRFQARRRRYTATAKESCRDLPTASG